MQNENPYKSPSVQQILQPRMEPGFFNSILDTAFRFKKTPLNVVIKGYIFILWLIYIIPALLLPPEEHSNFIRSLGFLPSGFLSGAIWQILIYQLMHGTLVHLFLNSVWIYLLGSDISDQLKSPVKFLLLYLVSSILGGVGIVTEHMAIEDKPVPYVGTLPLIYCFMVQYALFWPNRYIFLPKLKIKYIGLFFIVSGLLSEYPLQIAGGILAGLSTYYIFLAQKRTPRSQESNPYAQNGV